MEINPFANYELKLSLLGVASISIPAGQSVSHVKDIDESLLMTGAEYFCSGGPEDTVTLKILDSNGNVLAVPAKDIYVGPYGKYEFYQAVLSAGLKLEITYKNNGTEEAKIRYNLITHKNK